MYLGTNDLKLGIIITQHVSIYFTIPLYSFGSNSQNDTLKPVNAPKNLKNHSHPKIRNDLFPGDLLAGYLIQ
jgi:hypothetical protein